MAALFIGQALNDPYKFDEEQVVEENIVEPVQPKTYQKETKITQEEVKKTTSPKAVSIKPVQSTQPVSVNTVIQDLVAHFEKPDHYDIDKYRNMADTWDKIKNLDEEQLYEIYDQIAESSEKGVNWNVAKILYARMGELNPARAIEHAMTNKQGYAINGVISNWSKQSPMQALEWITNNKDKFPTSNNVDYTGLFRNVAAVDMNKALESLKEFDLAKQRNAFNGILKNLETNEGFMDVLSKAGEFNDPQNKIGSALYYWARKSPLDALAWAETIESDKDKKNAVRKVESAWLRENPLEAAAWLIEKKEDKNVAYSTIINNWDWRQGDKLLSWVQNQTNDDSKDNANYQIIRRYGYNNSDLAKEALDNIQSEEVRKKAVTQLYRSLKYRNQKAAEEFLKGRDEIPEEEKEKLLSSTKRR